MGGVMNNWTSIASKVRERIFKEKNHSPGDIVIVGGTYAEVVKASEGWLRLKIKGKEKIVRSCSVRDASPIELAAYKYAQGMPQFIVKYISRNPDSKQYEVLWNDVVDKLGSKFNYPVAVIYWKNKAEKELGPLPIELDKAVRQIHQKPMYVPPQ